jgi:hypothetical protein
MGRLANRMSKRLQDGTRAVDERPAAPKGFTQFETLRAESIALTGCALLDVASMLQGGEQAKYIIFVKI